MASLGIILEDFPDEVIIYVTDPHTGIQRRAKWPPTISEVLEACEAHQEYLVRLRAPRPIPALRLPPQLLADRPQGSLAQVFYPEGHEGYARLVEWTETAQSIWWIYGKSSDGRSGLWVSHGAMDEARASRGQASHAISNT